MMEMVQRITKEEGEQQKVLEECLNDEERIKLRKKYIDKKVENQKEVKLLMNKHKQESEYLEEMSKPKLDEVEMEEADEAGDGNHAGDEHGDGDDLGHGDAFGEGEEEHAA